MSGRVMASLPPAGSSLGAAIEKQAIDQRIDVLERLERDAIDIELRLRSINERLWGPAPEVSDKADACPTAMGVVYRLSDLLVNLESVFAAVRGQITRLEHL